MPESFKNLFNPEMIAQMGSHLNRVESAFDNKAFVKHATDNLEALELKERASQICDALQKTLPGDFRKAWGNGFDVYKLGGWAVGDDPLSNLANGPSSSNEVLTLRNKAGEVVDEVNYDDEGDWPSDSPDGPSITLHPDALDPEKNDAGKNWSRSEKGKHGAEHAKETDEYSKEDVGSPGTVATE